MEKNSRDVPLDPPLFLGEDWFDPIEAGIRGRVRGFIEALIEEELSEALRRARYQRPGQSAKPEASQGAAGYRHGESGNCSARSGRCGSACREPGWSMPRAQAGNSIARRCRDMRG